MPDQKERTALSAGCTEVFPLLFRWKSTPSMASFDETFEYIRAYESAVLTLGLPIIEWLAHMSGTSVVATIFMMTIVTGTHFYLAERAGNLKNN